MPKYNGADILIEYMIKEEVPYLFGVCGHGNVGLLEGAFKAADRIKTISTHHEQAAGYMADAYYKIAHRPAATFTSCGPGSCNLAIALAGALMDSSAYLAITANVPTQQFNRSPFQETGRFYQGDFPSVIRPYVKRSFQPTRVEMIPLAVKQAFGLMKTGRPGPVNIDVPLNVFVEEADVDIPEPDGPVSHRMVGDRELLAQAVALLAEAERPVIVAGQGVLLSEASEELAALAELMGLPVVTSPNGKSAIDERAALAYGSIGRNGTYAANEATRNADVILGVGCSFDDRTTSAWLPGYTFSIPPSRLIQIDLDPSEIGRNYPVHLGVVGDAKASLLSMAEIVRGRADTRRNGRGAWLRKLDEDRELWIKYQAPLAESNQMPVRPERLMKALSRTFPADGILATDVGVHHNWVVQLWESRNPRHLLQSWGWAAMGYATCGILGAKLAAPHRPALAVVGDGSFLMTPHILGTAAEYEIPAVWVVWNNYGYGSIRDLQHGMFQGHELATGFTRDRTGELYNPDFASLARSFGVEGVKVTQASDLEDVIQTALAANRPYLIDVEVDRDIRPVGTGSWALPPLPNPEPNFLKLAKGGQS